MLNNKGLKKLKLKDSIKLHLTKKNLYLLENFIKKEILKYNSFKGQITNVLSEEKKQSFRPLKQVKENKLNKYLPHKHWGKVIGHFSNNSIKNYAFFLENGVRSECVYFVKKYEKDELLLEQLSNLQASIEKEAGRVIRLRTLKGLMRVLEKIRPLITQLKCERKKARRNAKQVKFLRDLLKFRDSKKKATFKKLFYENMKTGKLKIDLEELTEQAEKLCRKVDIKDKFNRVLISEGSYLRRFGNYRKVGLISRLKVNFYKKKVLNCLALVLASLSKKYLLEKLSAQKTSQEVSVAVAEGFLGEIKLGLGVLGSSRYFFKKIQKNKKISKASALFRLSVSKFKDNLGYSSLLIKKRRAYITKKLKKWKLVWGLLIKLKNPKIKGDLKSHSRRKVRGRREPKLYFWKSLVFSRGLRKRTLNCRLKKQRLKAQLILGETPFWFFYKNRRRVVKIRQDTKKRALLRFFMANKGLKRRRGFVRKTPIISSRLITHNRLFNKVSKTLLIKRFFIHNMLYRIKLKRRSNKSEEINGDVYFFFRKFSYYKNNQGLISIFKLAFFLALKKKKTFDLANNLFINDKALAGYLVKSYSRETLKTELNKKTFFFNFSKKKLNIYKVARRTHWLFFVKGKKLNKRRYSAYIKKYMRISIKFTHTLLFMLVNKFKLSFLFWESFFCIYKDSYSLNSSRVKKIYQLPIHKYFWSFLVKQNHKREKIAVQIRVWQLRFLKIKRTFWMKQKKKLPKILKKKTLSNEESCRNVHFDFLTNYFFLFSIKNNYSSSYLDYFNRNKFLKLHDFRYKA